MRAVVLREIGDPDRLLPELVPDPTPKPGEVLVHVRASSVHGRIVNHQPPAPEPRHRTSA